MSSFASRTMQKLYSARLLAEHLEALEQQDELVRPAFKVAHLEAVLFQLQGAFQSLLYEIAETARISGGEWHSVEDLQQEAEKLDKHLPQLNVLKELQADSYGWLSQFQKRYQDVWLPVSAPVQQQTSGADLIGTAPEELSEINQINSWIDNMQALIRDLRQTMQEF